MNDILFGNNNKKVVKKLSARYFKSGKSRNIIAITAIVLTTILFTTIFTLGSGLIDTIKDQNIRKLGGDGQAVLSYINDEVFDRVKGSALIDRIAYTKSVSYRLNNPGLKKWRSDMWYMDDIALEFARYEPVEGRSPQAENEIIADTRTLDALGVPAEIGATVTLNYEIKGSEYTTDFKLCGFWETDSLSNTGRIIVSKAFIDSNLDLLAYTYPVDNDYSGVVTAYLMFRGGGSVEAKLHGLLAETGYTCDTMGGLAADDNYIIARVSPVYQSNGLTENPPLLISGIVCVLLIMITGYLIIYNIFQISVIGDIQSYGQLKTLGMTKRQIRKLINQQAFRLSLAGIPVGLLLGFLIGRSLVPFLMNGTVYSADAGVKVTVNPLIFIGSAVFAFATVYISVRKPAAIAGMVSPVEAIRYSQKEAGAFQKKTADKKTSNGAKLHRMALSNLSRNRKRTILVITSMTLSLVLFNTVFTLSGGFDIDKYIEKFVNRDFVISSADYFNFNYEQSDTELSESFIDAVRQQSAYKDGGRLYSNRITEENFSAETDAVTNLNMDKDGNPLVDFYGADEYLLNSMDIVEGVIDWELLQSGNYVLYALTSDDNGAVIDNPSVRVGDTIRFRRWKMDGLSGALEQSFELTVMAKIRINENTDTTRSTGAARFYLPIERFLSYCSNPHLVNFSFDVADGADAEMEEFLTGYVKDVEPQMNYDSKATYANSFHDLTSLIITIGGTLSIVIGLIGVANFINSVLTSIITRQKEFAMLQSIGMTGKQLRRMLSYEGLYYAAGTIAASLAIGTLFSSTLVRAITNGIWFFTYRFVVWPMLIVYPFLILLTIIIPIILYMQTAKVSIIERLRQN